VVAHSDARRNKKKRLGLRVAHGRKLTDGRTRSGTHKNNTPTDKAAEPNRKWYIAIVIKYGVGVGDVSTVEKKKDK
jgi:hypothetical protein